MTVAIIPARGGSKRLPGKNLMPLGGIPLIAHSIRYVLANPSIIDRVVVTTDDPQIKAVALEYGAEVIDRPEAISGDFEPTVSAVQHVLESGFFADTIVLLQPTNPLRPENLLTESMEKFSSAGRQSLFTVSRNSHKFGTIDADRFTPYNYTPGQRSQDLEPLYFENGLLYITASDAIRKGEIITGDAFPLICDHVFSAVDIDTAEDFEYAEYLYTKHTR